MIPLVEIRRTDQLFWSAMYRLPDESMAMLVGYVKVAWAAGPPSPCQPVVLLPAMVVTIPVLAVTMRMRWLRRSAIYRLPDLSTAIPAGLASRALVAGPPSPANPPAPPSPATVVMIPLVSTFRTLLLEVSAI